MNVYWRHTLRGGGSRRLTVLRLPRLGGSAPALVQRRIKWVRRVGEGGSLKRALA